MGKFHFDANKALRSVVAFFVSLFVLLTLLPIFHYLYTNFGDMPHSKEISLFIGMVMVSLSIFIGMCIRWIFNIRVTQYYDCLAGYGMGAGCLLVGAFFTKGIVLILSLPTCILATYLLFWHMHKAHQNNLTVDPE